MHCTSGDIVMRFSLKEIQRLCLVLLHFLKLVTLTESVIQVEIASIGYVDPKGGNGALAYHVPAYEAAINDSNRIYACTFNFSLTVVTGDRTKIVATPQLTDNAMDILAEWYYGKGRTLDSVAVIITPGTRKYSWWRYEHMVVCLTEIGALCIKL